MPQGVSLAGPMGVRWWCRVQKPPKPGTCGRRGRRKQKCYQKRKPSGHSKPSTLLSWLPKRKITSGRRLRRLTPYDRNIDHVHVSLSCLLSLSLPTYRDLERERWREKLDRTKSDQIIPFGAKVPFLRAACI